MVTSALMVEGMEATGMVGEGTAAMEVGDTEDTDILVDMAAMAEVDMDILEDTEAIILEDTEDIIPVDTATMEAEDMVTVEGVMDMAIRKRNKTKYV